MATTRRRTSIATGSSLSRRRKPSSAFCHQASADVKLKGFAVRPLELPRRRRASHPYTVDWSQPKTRVMIAELPPSCTCRARNASKVL